MNTYTVEISVLHIVQVKAENANLAAHEAQFKTSKESEIGVEIHNTYKQSDPRAIGG